MYLYTWTWYEISDSEKDAQYDGGYRNSTYIDIVIDASGSDKRAAII